MRRSLLVLSWLVIPLFSCYANAGVPGKGAQGCFVSGRKLGVVDLDRSEWAISEYGETLLPYRWERLESGLWLLRYLGEDLSCGFALVNDQGRVRQRLNGYAAYPVNEKFLLAVAVTGSSEHLPEDTRIAVISLDEPVRRRQFAHTTVLWPLAYDLAPGQPAARTAGARTLLVTFIPRRFSRDYSYLWAPKLKFTSLNSEGMVVWESEVVTRQLLVDIELLWAGERLCVLYGRYGYVSGEYFALSQDDGSLRWQEPSTVLPTAMPQYPYVNFAEVLPAEADGELLRFPAYDSREPKRMVAELGLESGKLTLVEDSGWLARADGVLRERLTAPLGAASWCRDLGCEETLVLEANALSLFRGAEQVWSCPVAARFGEGLELEACGEKLLLLIERPAAAVSLGAQGVPHLVDRATGQAAPSPLGRDVQFFRPLTIGGRTLLLTPTRVILQ